jgi:hypothetical protein
MQLASLDNSAAANAQAAMVKPNFVATSQSLSRAKKASQNAAEKGGKLARASYSSSKAAAAFAARIEKTKAPKPSSLKSKTASQ